MRFFIAYLVAFFIVGAPATLYAQTPPSKTTVTTKTKAENLRVLPPWTMRKCPKDLFATYDLSGAQQLKLRDNDCHLWHIKQIEQAAVIKLKDTALTKLQLANQAADDINQYNTIRLEELTKQVKAEIAEKNEYKYKPNYSWLYISIGAALAAVGVAFGIGVWVEKG